MVMFSYEYGVDIDECYADLRTALDTASLQLPEDASTPVVIELNMSQSADMILNVRAEGELDLKKTLEDTLIPDMESITDVAQVDVSGGTQDYIRVLLREDMLKQYGAADLAELTEIYGQTEVDESLALLRVEKFIVDQAQISEKVGEGDDLAENEDAYTEDTYDTQDGMEADTGEDAEIPEEEGESDVPEEDDLVVEE